MGRVEEAEELIKKLKEDLGDIFQHQLTHLVIRTNIIESLTLLKKGQKDASKERAEQAIKDYDALVNSPSKDPIQGFAHTLVGELYYLSKDYKKALQEYKMAEDIYDAVLSVKEVDDLSDLYYKIILATVGSHQIELTREYLQKQLKFFGLDHARTQKIALYFDEKEIPIPW